MQKTKLTLVYKKAADNEEEGCRICIDVVQVFVGLANNLGKGHFLPRAQMRTIMKQMD